MGMFLRRGLPAKRLGKLPEGSIIKLSESGTLVEFYVAKHDYEPDLNGSGRTLMVRKDCYDARVYGASNVFSGSNILTWLNQTYLATLPAAIREMIGETTFYYTNSGGKVLTLNYAIFLLSATELGFSAIYANVEGSALDIASMLKTAYMDGTATGQWTRTRYMNNTTNVCYSRAAGDIDYTNGNTSKLGSRPVFTLPSDLVVTDDMLA